jgi:hypothetical protein
MYECVCCQCGFSGREDFLACASCNMYGTKDDFSNAESDVCDSCSNAFEQTNNGGTYAERK